MGTRSPLMTYTIQRIIIKTVDSVVLFFLGFNVGV